MYKNLLSTGLLQSNRNLLSFRRKFKWPLISRVNCFFKVLIERRNVDVIQNLDQDSLSPTKSSIRPKKKVYADAASISSSSKHKVTSDQLQRKIDLMTHQRIIDQSDFINVMKSDSSPLKKNKAPNPAKPSLDYLPKVKTRPAVFNYSGPYEAGGAENDILYRMTLKNIQDRSSSKFFNVIYQLKSW